MCGACTGRNEYTEEEWDSKKVHMIWHALAYYRYDIQSFQQWYSMKIQDRPPLHTTSMLHKRLLDTAKRYRHRLKCLKL